MKTQPMPKTEKIAYICLAIVLIYLAVKTGYDLYTHYEPTMTMPL